MIQFGLAETVSSAVRGDGVATGSEPDRIARRRFPTDPAGLAPELASRLRARQVRAIGRLSASVMIVNIANAATLVAILHVDGHDSPMALLWAAFVLLVSLWSLWRSRRAARRPPRETCSPATVRKVIRSAALFGVVWSVPGLTFLPHLDGFSLAFAASVTTGMIAGGALALYPIPAAALAYMGPVVVCSIAGFWVVHGLPVAGMALLAAMFLFVFWTAIKRHAELFMAEFLSRIELDRQMRLIEEMLEDTRLELAGSREQSQERMAQAQRMEAFGKLTAGVAHDFNNLLTAIRGSAELMLKGKTFDAGLLRAMLQVSDRGASQVSRLLAIAQKQHLQPREVKLPDLLNDVRRVMEPTLGPAHPIQIRIGSTPPPVIADPAHLESALFNLIFNARDAMPDGGEIVLSVRRAARATGNPQIAITVADQGHGMTAEVMARATEPFFTTKKFGQGSGLGLSSVAGFARQSGGDISILSAPGAGTTVTMLLPAGETGFDDLDRPPAEVRPAVVLVVEDDPTALPVTLEMVASLGYRALGAATAEQAIGVVACEPRIDLVLTDILLSGPMTGFQLAKSLQRTGSHLAVAFMSEGVRGVTGSEIGHDIRLLRKPLGRGELADLLSQALAGPEQPSVRTSDPTGPGDANGDAKREMAAFQN